MGRDHFTIIYNFAWGLQGECGLDVDWKHACSGSGLMSFVSKVSRGIESFSINGNRQYGHQPTAHKRNYMDNSNLLPTKATLYQ
jgi:hypothetical protein